MTFVVVGGGPTGVEMAGALAEIVIGYTGLVGLLLRFVGPVTIAPTIALIGLSLNCQGLEYDFPGFTTLKFSNEDTVTFQ